MKNFSLLLPLLILLLPGVPARAAVAAAESKVSTPVIVERGPHHRVWRQEQVTTLPDGRLRTNSTSHTELASGMHRWDAQTDHWIEAEPRIELFGEGALGRSAAHSVGFSANANTAGAIDLVTPDGLRLRSHVIGLAFLEPRTGRSEFFAELQDSLGELHAPDTVIYPEAFNGVKANLRYVNKISGFEQFVVLLENPPLPPDFDPATCMIEVWTEFLSPPEPTVKTEVRAGMTDDSVKFGSMEMAPGVSFALGEEQTKGASIPMAKRWLVIEGRSFLVESVRYVSARPKLETLPPGGQARIAPAQPAGVLQAGLRVIPPAPRPREARVKNPPETFRTAALKLPPPEVGRGFVLDYNLQTAHSNFTFQSDTTYVLSNAVNLTGTTTFEGGSVIKYAPTNIATITLAGPAEWRTGPYRPAVFTSVDDHSVGATVGTNILSGYYGGKMLSFTANPSNAFEHVRFSHARTAVKSTGDGFFTLRHAQLVHCDTAIDYQRTSGTVSNENVLFYDVNTVSYGGAYFIGTHVTVDRCTIFADSTYASSTLLVNSLLLDVSDIGNTSPSLTASYEGEEANTVFQTVGGAAHYLVANSPHRNVGTTSIPGNLLNDIRQRTTYPPVLLTNQTIGTSITLSPQAQRDTDSLDRGYHYAPLDFVFGVTWITNTLTLTPGTAVGVFAPDGYYGVQLQGGQIACVGTATAPNRFARYNTVQEQANTNWNGRGPMFVTTWNSAAPPVQARFRFTEFTALAGDSFLFDYQGQDADLSFTDCRLQAGNLQTSRASLHFTNSLLDRVGGWLESFDYDAAFDARHCLFREVRFDYFARDSAATWTLTDNLFDNAVLNADGSMTHSYNAYTTNSGGTTLLFPTNATGNKYLAVTNFAYHRGPLGDYYQPTNSALTNAGSTWATNVGLYHFTITTNQVKEAATMADIGLHYVALNSSGQPVDTDGDGIPDYLEDANGNGSADSGETSWSTAYDWGLRVFITRPRSGGNTP